MKPANRHVLMVRQPHGKGTITYPVSVHSNDKTAALHRARLASAVKAGDVGTVQALAPHFRLTEEGQVPTDVKYRVVALPYEPEGPAEASAGDDFDF